MKVLFVNENIGGHRTVHANLRAALSDHVDVQADFLDVPHPPPPVQRLAGAPIPGLARLDLDLQPLRAQLAKSAWVRRHLSRRIASYDVVHLYTQSAALLSTALLRTHPSVVTLDTTNALNAFRLPYRSPTRFTPWMSRATRPFEQGVYRSAGALVANSTWAARSLIDDYGVAPARVSVVPFGIELPPPPPPSPTADMPRIVFVGTRLERKGGRLLLDLHQAALADRCELVLVTKDSVPAGRNVTVINDLEPGDERLWTILRSATLFVFPSEIDQAPNVVLEAAAAGLPVVALDVAAISEMVVDGKTGILPAPGDGPALRAAIEVLIGDPGKAHAMGQAGRAHIEAHYDMRRSLDHLLEVLRAVAQR